MFGLSIEQPAANTCRICGEVDSRKCYTCKHYDDIGACEICKNKHLYIAEWKRCPECGKEWTR